MGINGNSEDDSTVYTPKSNSFSRQPMQGPQPSIPTSVGYDPNPKFEPSVPVPPDKIPVPDPVVAIPPDAGEPPAPQASTALQSAAWVAQHLEGGEAFHEKNGDVTRFGLGDSGGYSAGMSASTPEAAGQIYLDKYASLPHIKENFSQLTDPRDQVAALQLALHRPAWLQSYFKDHPVTSEQPFNRQAMLDYQEAKYNASPGQYTQSFINRVDKTRGYDPQPMVAQL
jgi:hypothetical protein